MSGRIWPGALCWIVASEFPENIGRVVTAESLECDSPRMWSIVSEGPPLKVWDYGEGDDYLSSDAVALEELLVPITPPPASDTTETDDTAPCEVEPAHPDRVSA